MAAAGHDRARHRRDPRGPAPQAARGRECPAPGVEGEEELCEKTRALLETVDWPCEVGTDFAGSHLSQTERIESGLDWVFGQAEQAIVLEDDCVPDPSFFPYCDELLERHRDAERVMSVSGDNFQFEEPASEDSYYFSRFPQTWGWATWRRAWEGHDREMTAWPELRDSGWLEEIFDEPSAAAYWAHFLEANYRDRDAWDRAWLLTSLMREAVHAIPNVNLVSNIGFREDATHTHPEYARAVRRPADRADRVPTAPPRGASSRTRRPTSTPTGSSSAATSPRCCGESGTCSASRRRPV